VTRLSTHHYLLTHNQIARTTATARMKILRSMLVLTMTTSTALAGGGWKDSPLHQWFEGLSSKLGLCCSKAEGLTLADVEWDMKDGHYAYS